jgi:hypothetical protein
MQWFSILLTVVGLALFETVSSVDNAIINAEVLGGMGARARRWFLTWGIFVAVFLVRGLLPWLIVWGVLPELGPVSALTATFSADPAVGEAIEAARPPLLAAGGVFLVLLFLRWIFIEPKAYGLPGERLLQKNGVWFYTVSSLFLTAVVFAASRVAPTVAFSACVGSTAFFVSTGFKENAEREEAALAGSGRSDLAKLLFLEIIDLTFSIDGVLGAFAFTLSVPIILIGNGIGAVIVRQITVGSVEKIKLYRYLKNGAMYSILFLGAIMTAEGFGLEAPDWLTPVATIGVIGYFFLKSARELKRGGAPKAA